MNHDLGLTLKCLIRVHLQIPWIGLPIPWQLYYFALKTIVNKLFRFEIVIFDTSRISKS
jgi:hypothetical protein